MGARKSKADSSSSSKEAAAKGPLGVIEDFLTNSEMWGEEACPFDAWVKKGHQRVALIAGPNASGKSFLAECAMSWGKQWCGTRSMSVSIRERTGSGSGDMSGLKRTMMFGSEEDHSTGAVSARVVRTGFSSVENWCKEIGGTILLLDEPELGLSEGFCYAMGELIGREVLKMNARACGVVVISHSKALAQGLADGLGEAPSFVSTGGAMSFEQWLKRQERFSADDLIALGDKDREGFLGVRSMLEGLRSKKK